MLEIKIYNFVKVHNFDKGHINHILNDINHIYLTKEGNSFYASVSEPDFLLLYNCPVLKKNLTNVVFDPGKGYDE